MQRACERDIHAMSTQHNPITRRALPNFSYTRTDKPLVSTRRCRRRRRRHSPYITLAYPPPTYSPPTSCLPVISNQSATPDHKQQASIPRAGHIINHGNYFLRFSPVLLDHPNTEPEARTAQPITSHQPWSNPSSATSSTATNAKTNGTATRAA
jgi:hypothetical protein